MIKKSNISINNKNQTKDRSNVFGRFFVWFFLVIILFLGFGFLSRVPGMKVTIGEYENIVVTDTDEITESLKIYLNERFLYPRSNRFWFSKKHTERYVKNNFPRIASLHVSTSKGEISISGTEREGKYLWCGMNVIDVHIGNTCYFADNTGFIFDKAPYFSGTSYLRLYGGGVNQQSVIGSQVGSMEVFELYEFLNKTLEEFNFKIQAIFILSDGQIEFLLTSNNPLTQSPRLKYYLLNDQKEVSQNIIKALGQEKVLLDIRDNYGRLDYLDTRFKNQIIYKFFDFSDKSQTLVEDEKPIEELNTEINEETGNETYFEE